MFKFLKIFIVSKICFYGKKKIIELKHSKPMREFKNFLMSAKLYERKVRLSYLCNASIYYKEKIIH